MGSAGNSLLVVSLWDERSLTVLINVCVLLLSGCEPMKQLYEILLKAPGVFGARFSGAGFRGCCLAFVDSEYTIEAASYVKNEYYKVQPVLASQTNPATVVVICEAGDCAQVI